MYQSPSQIASNNAVLVAFEALPGYDKFVEPKFSSFEETRAFACSLGLKNRREWKEYVKTKRPKNIPSDPSRTYKSEWISWFNWLGNEFFTFEDARAIVRRQKLKNSIQWRGYCKTQRPRNIPSNPHRIYQDEWISWPDWLGYGYDRFEEARAFARSLDLMNKREWLQHERPKNIPGEPHIVYQEWVSWPDWLGYELLPFEEARAYVRSIGLRSKTQWDAVPVFDSGNFKAKFLKNIPSNPHHFFKDEWISWADWLGYGFLQFEEAKAYVWSLGFKKAKEWKEYSKTKRPKNIPSNPSQFYRDEWINMNDWLGDNRCTSPSQHLQNMF
jgi:hypothetical protein